MTAAKIKQFLLIYQSITSKYSINRQIGQYYSKQSNLSLAARLISC